MHLIQKVRATKLTRHGVCLFARERGEAEKRRRLTEQPPSLSLSLCYLHTHRFFFLIRPLSGVGGVDGGGDDAAYNYIAAHRVTLERV